jgi:enolase
VAKAAARSRPAALPLCRRRLGPCPAGADDEHHQRRRHADNPIDIQEFMIMPVGAASFAEACAWARRSSTPEEGLKDAGHNTNVGDEGGFAPNLGRRRRGAGLHRQGDRGGRLQAGDDVVLALDVRRDRVLQGRQVRPGEGEGKTLDPAGMVDYLAGLARYPIVSIEDGMAEDDWDGWKALTDRLGAKVQLVGDDLFVTNTERLADGIDEGSPTPSWSRSTRSAR